jgi:hypothetical protein
MRSNPALKLGAGYFSNMPGKAPLKGKRGGDKSAKIRICG